jgi:hypothetical protein
MFRIPPPEIAKRMSDEHRLDLLAQAGQPPSRGIKGVKSSKAVGVARRHLLAALVVASGLAIPWPQAQLSGAAAQGRDIAAHQNTTPIANPPEGHTGIIVPPASGSSVFKLCPARNGNAAQAHSGMSFKSTTPVANPPEGHTGIVVPPPSGPSAVERRPRTGDRPCLTYVVTSSSACSSHVHRGASPQRCSRS